MAGVGQEQLRQRLLGPADRAARALLGCRLVAGGVTVRLTEVEAYGGVAADAASHAHRGPTARNSVMFGAAGHAYVYFTYGMHWCLNVVCGRDGEAAAVLLRAAAIVDGIEAARQRRPTARRDVDLARGPARLCQALGVDGTANGVDLFADGPLRLLPRQRPIRVAEISAGPRVGVTGEHERPWRFWLATEPSVTVYRRHTPRGSTR
jgi:DNA-3-methyladenine glycosylase